MDTPTQTPQTPPVQNQAPNNTPPQAPIPPVQNGNGPLIGIIIIVLVLAAGAFYLYMNSQWYQSDDSNSPSAVAPANNETANPIDAVTEALKKTSSSDSASAIEADLKATQTGNMDADLSQTGSQI
jgi:uncharacterized protein HemX